MLRSSCGRFWKGAERAQAGFAGPPHLLRGAVHVQRRSDGAVSAELTASAVSAGNGVQQRGKHHTDGAPRLVSVRRGRGAPLAAGRSLCAPGACAGDSSHCAAVASAAGPRRPIQPPPGVSRTAAAAVRAAAAKAAGTTTAAAAAAAASPSAPAAGSSGGRAVFRWGEGGLRRPGTWVCAAAAQPAAGTRAAASATQAAIVGSAPVTAPEATPCDCDAAGAPLAAVWPPLPEPSGAGVPNGEAERPSAAPNSNTRLPLADEEAGGSGGTSCSSSSSGGTNSASKTGAAARASPASACSPATPAGSGDGAGATAGTAAASGSGRTGAVVTPSRPSFAPASASPLACAPAQSDCVDRTSGLGRLGRISYRLILAYDGTDYCGWQLQPSAPTVQRCLEAALCTVLREERAALGVRAAGRTDSGVHASGQVVQFSCNRELDVSKMPYKLNSVLPHDIRVLRISRTAPDFSVTCSALGKCYHYNLTNAEVHDPLRHRYALHVRQPLELGAMRAAAAALVGTHDFTQFSNIGEEGGRPRKRNPVKTLSRVDVVELGRAAPGGIRIEVEGSGFLYKMVRHISGVLVAVGEGRLSVAAVSRMLEVGNNEPPGCHGTYRGYNVAPAKGLCLHEVFYDTRVDDPSALLYPNLRHDEYGRLLESIPDARSDEE